uniref:LysM domain-containing protein n=1 Tax=Colletotrichum fructicola (strain Nara gc5) TaxID=1213859 RepID=L2G1C2_COLFN
MTSLRSSSCSQSSSSHSSLGRSEPHSSGPQPSSVSDVQYGAGHCPLLPSDYVPGEWRNDTNSAPRQCDDCILEPMQLEVNSPISHTESRADEFKSASSCVASGYAAPHTQPDVLLRVPRRGPPGLVCAGRESLVEWNPKLYIQCASLNATTGYICVGPPAINIKPSNASVDMTNRTSHYIRVSLP